MPNMMAGLGI